MENLYKKNPIVVLAYQFNPEGEYKPAEGFRGTELTGDVYLVGEHDPLPVYLDEKGPFLWIPTKHGFTRVNPGEWLIRESDDSGWYPCTDEVFRATYTRMKDAMEAE